MSITDCPTQTVINAVFGLKGAGVPADIAEMVRNCDDCFTSFYGPHFSKEELESKSYKALDWQERLHFDHCDDCKQQHRKFHQYSHPDKIGKSHPGYISAIS